MMKIIVIKQEPSMIIQSAKNLNFYFMMKAKVFNNSIAIIGFRNFWLLCNTGVRVKALAKFSTVIIIH